MAEQPDVIRAGVLDGVPHGFLGRRGGLSVGAAAGLNAGLGSADDPVAVRANREIAANAVLTGAALASVYQVHSPDCVIVMEACPIDQRPRADALVTSQPGLLLGIVTADCAPVLLADPAVGVIGAAHAGWKGAVAGVTDRTIAAMESLGADRTRIVAAIGPCIAQTSYEVDERFRDDFVAGGAQYAAFFAAGRPGHWQFDLEGYVAARLSQAGVERIERLGLDTYAEPARFYSFRRATHRGEADYGRQISLIGLPFRPD